MVHTIKMSIHNNIFSDRELKRFCRSRNVNFTNNAWDKDEAIDQIQNVDIVVIWKLDNEKDLEKIIKKSGKPLIDLRRKDLTEIPKEVLEITKGEKEISIAYFAICANKKHQQKAHAKGVLGRFIDVFQDEVKIPARLFFSQELFRQMQINTTLFVITLLTMGYYFIAPSNWWWASSLIFTILSFFTSFNFKHIITEADSYGLGKYHRIVAAEGTISAIVAIVLAFAKLYENEAISWEIIKNFFVGG